MTMPSPVTMSLPFAPSSAGIARQRLKQWLVGAGASDETIEDSRLVVSELVGNAVRHAVPLDDDTLLVAWGAAGTAGTAAQTGPETLDTLDIAVTDGGAATVPQQVRAAPGDESGRGLGIVGSVSDRWWFETTRSRSTVHALVQLAGATAPPQPAG